MKNTAETAPTPEKPTPETDAFIKMIATQYPTAWDARELVRFARTLERQRDAAIRERQEETAKDKTRLDWLEATPTTITKDGSNWELRQHPSVRAAIDAAIAAANGEGK